MHSKGLCPVPSHSQRLGPDEQLASRAPHQLEGEAPQTTYVVCCM